MKKIELKSNQKKEVINLTNQIQQAIQKAKFHNGFCQLNALHTTVGLTIADLDPGTDSDYLNAIEHMIPKLDYRHPHNTEPSHVGAHLMSAIIGTSLGVPVQNGKLILGTWQQIILIELDGPKKREITLTLLGS